MQQPPFPSGGHPSSATTTSRQGTPLSCTADIYVYIAAFSTRLHWLEAPVGVSGAKRISRGTPATAPVDRTKKDVITILCRNSTGVGLPGYDGMNVLAVSCIAVCVPAPEHTGHRGVQWLD